MLRVRRPEAPTLLASALVAVLSLGAPAAHAQVHDVCFTAHVPEAFTLPDGTLHAAGRISLCAVIAMSPAAGVHRVWLEGEGAKIVLSHRTVAEAPADSPPSLLFKRDAQGVLDLVGFVVPEGRKAWTYSLRRGVERFATSTVTMTAAD